MDWANCRIKPHHRSTGGGRRTQRSVFPARLWTALRVQVSSSPLSARSWLVDGSSATPALAFSVFLSLFHVFPRSWAFASFLGPYFMGKIWIFRTTYCVATLGSVSLVSSSTRVLDLYAVRDPEWKSPDPRPIIHCNRSIIRRRLTDDRAWIAGSPPGVGPLKASADLRSIALMTSCGHRTAIAGSPFDDLRIFSATFRTVAPRSPLDDRTVSHGPPPDEEKWGGIGRSSGKF